MSNLCTRDALQGHDVGVLEVDEAERARRWRRPEAVHLLVVGGSDPCVLRGQRLRADLPTGVVRAQHREHVVLARAAELDSDADVPLQRPATTHLDGLVRTPGVVLDELAVRRMSKSSRPKLGGKAKSRGRKTWTSAWCSSREWTQCRNSSGGRSAVRVPCPVAVSVVIGNPLEPACLCARGQASSPPSRRGSRPAVTVPSSRHHRGRTGSVPSRADDVLMTSAAGRLV
jgi:hypothetical protein